MSPPVSTQEKHLKAPVVLLTLDNLPQKIAMATMTINLVVIATSLQHSARLPVPGDGSIQPDLGSHKYKVSPNSPAKTMGE